MLFTACPAPTISIVSGTPSVPAVLMSVAATCDHARSRLHAHRSADAPGRRERGGVPGVGDTPYVFDFTFSYVVDGLDDSERLGVLPADG